MGSRAFKTIRKAKPRKPTRAQVLRAARAILYPEAGDPLPELGSALDIEAKRFVAYIGRREEAKLRKQQEGQHGRPS